MPKPRFSDRQGEKNGGRSTATVMARPIREAAGDISPAAYLLITSIIF